MKSNEFVEDSFVIKGEIIYSEAPDSLRLMSQSCLVMDFSDVISTYVYRIGIQAGNFSAGTAVGLFQSVVCVVFLVGANAITEKCGEQGIW